MVPPDPPLGIYVHIPFCVRKCHYCDFVAGPAPDEIRSAYVAALEAEIRACALAGAPVRTVYFGGGTPSELNSAALARIVAALRDSFSFVAADLPEAQPPSPLAGSAFAAPAGCHRPPPPLTTTEWTIECNPGTVCEESLRAMHEMGFNRISLGVQTFSDIQLQRLGRIHTAAEAADAVQMARRVGFNRLSVDLIFCLPEQTLAEWQDDVEQALLLGPEHLSLYNLTIEPETEFGRRHRAGCMRLPDDDLGADMYEWVMDRLSEAGFALYEVSNFARPGEASRHNSLYWRHEPYLGFGVGASAYLRGTRWTHTRSMQAYLASAARPGGPERAVEETLPPRAACGEAIVLALRTSAGADVAALAARYGVDSEREFGVTLRGLEQDGLLVRDGARTALTRAGLLLANTVCSQFL